MSEPAATLEVRTINDVASVVEMRGEITARCEGLLMDAYARASGSRTRVIVLNFSGLEYMNSGGIGLVVTLLIRANRQKQRLLACGLSDHYREIFELTRLDEAIGIHDSEPAALAAAGVV